MPIPDSEDAGAPASGNRGLTVGSPDSGPNQRSRPWLHRRRAVVAVAVAALAVAAVLLLVNDRAPRSGASSGGPTFVEGPEGSVAVPGLDAQGNPTTGPAVVGEVAPPGADSGEGPGSAPALATHTPLPLPSPLPSSATAEGAVVDGFPDNVIGVPDGARIETSGVSVDGARMQVSLVAASSDSVLETLDFYRGELGPLGFTESSRPAIPGTTAVAFTRGANALLVSVRPDGSGSRFSVTGVLSPDG